MQPIHVIKYWDILRVILDETKLQKNKILPCKTFKQKNENSQAVPQSESF